MKRLLVIFLFGCGGAEPAVVNDDGGAADLAVPPDLGGRDLSGADLSVGPDLSALQAFSCGTQPRSLSADVKPILGSCGGEMCHGLLVSSPQSIYNWLVNQTGEMECPDGRKLVVPGDPEHSYVIDKLTNRNLCSGEPMPKSFSVPWVPLDRAKIQTIYDWICQGAKND